MKTYAFVFARGGSKGVPRKNIRQLVDKPLIGHAITLANHIADIERSFVSTDCPEIAKISESFGATIIPRPIFLAQDNSPEWLAWRHAVKWVHKSVGPFDRFLSLPATAPMRLEEDIRRCSEALDEETDVVVTMTPAKRSPWFNMVKVDKGGYVQTLIEGEYFRRQDAPEAFDLTTLVYLMRPNFIMTHENLWQGRVRGVLIPQERSIDIDTELDFNIAEFLMQEQIRSQSKNVK